MISGTDYRIKDDRLLLRGGRIIDPSQDMDDKADILVEHGMIKQIDRVIEAGSRVPTLHLEKKWIVPGLIDMHVHLREPGEEYKETIKTGSMAGAAGGFTALACMPNTSPVNSTSTVTKFIIERAREAALARVYPVATITRDQNGKQLSEFGDLLGAGAIAFSDDGLPVEDSSVMRLAMEYSLNFDALIISHSEDLQLSRGGLMNEGRVSTILGLKGIPKAAEEVAIARDIALAELTGARLHIAHVSTKGSLDIIRRAKDRGVKVTAETAPHYFSLTEEAVMGYNTLAKMNPPLRTEEDRLAIIEGLRDGTIDAIATDHAPHSVLEKECEFELAANGIIGLETALPLVLDLVKQGAISSRDMVRLMSERPASILGISGGTLKVGSPADITIIDPDRPFTLTREHTHSKSHNSPFYGRSFQGKAILTLLEGVATYDLDALLS